MNYNIDIADIGLESQQILYYLENGHPASGALTHELCAIFVYPEFVYIAT